MNFYNDMLDKKTSLVLLILLSTLVIFLAIFPADIILPAMPSMAVVFNKSISSLSLTITFYLITLGCSLLIFGPLSDFLGRKRVFLFGLWLALLGSLICYSATTFNAFFAGRMIEAMGAASFVIIHAIIKDRYEGRLANNIRIYIVTLAGVSLACAPMLGATIVNSFGWRTIFILFSIIVLMTIALAMLTLSGKSNSKENNIKALQRDFLALRQPRFFLLTIICAISFCFHFSFIVASPQIMLERFHFSITQYAWIMLSYGFAFLAGGVLSTYISTRYSIKHQFYCGYLLILLASISLLVLFINYTIVSYMLSMILMTTGVSMLTPASMSLALEACPQTVAGSAVTMISFIRYVLGGTVTSIGGTMLFYHKFGFASMCFILMMTLCCLMKFYLNYDDLYEKELCSEQSVSKHS